MGGAGILKCFSRLIRLYEKFEYDFEEDWSDIGQNVSDQRSINIMTDIIKNQLLDSLIRPRFVKHLIIYGFKSGLSSDTLQLLRCLDSFRN